MLDTASFIAAVRSSRGAAREIVRLILIGEVVPLMDHKLSLEYRDVALRPEHLIASGVSKSMALVFIDAIEARAEPIEVEIKHRPMSSDPNDDMILDVAINGRADALVTNNAKHFVAAGRKFGISVMSPREFLKMLRKGDQHGD